MGRLSMHGLTALAVLCSSVSSIVAEDAALAPTCHDQGEADTESISSQLLQQRSSLQDVGEHKLALSKDPTTAFTWMHVPRSGSSFAYTLLQHEGVCDWGMSLDEHGSIPVDLQSVLEHCPGLSVPENFESCNPMSDFLKCTEQGISSDWSSREGNVVGMFRQPEVRLMSEWNWEIANGHNFPSVDEFARARQGCYTKMLTSSTLIGHCEADAFPTLDEVKLAVERVETGFSFVGMTDQWDLSMCLFNAMFGHTCHASQFAPYSVHTSTSSSTDVSLLGGFVDKFDAPVWAMAQRKFQDALDRYGVSEDTCEPCMDDAVETE